MQFSSPKEPFSFSVTATAAVSFNLVHRKGHVASQKSPNPYSGPTLAATPFSTPRSRMFNHFSPCSPLCGSRCRQALGRVPGRTRLVRRKNQAPGGFYVLKSGQRGKWKVVGKLLSAETKGLKMFRRFSTRLAATGSAALTTAFVRGILNLLTLALTVLDSLLRRTLRSRGHTNRTRPLRSLSSSNRTQRWSCDFRLRERTTWALHFFFSYIF